MKIKLTKDRRIKGKPCEYKAGDTITVPKDVGERLISKGLANRIINTETTATENRITVASEDRGHRRFHNHKKF